MLLEKLQKIQYEMKAPKNLFNKFGNYSYRNAEGILEAFKPFGEKYKVALVISDEIVNIGDRYYIKATATLLDIEDINQRVNNTAYARESFDKKGMDDSQITGTASSYARKYALNGLFLLDDTKDADTDEYHEETTKKAEKKPEKKEEKKPITKEQIAEIRNYFSDDTALKAMLDWFKVSAVTDLTEAQAKVAIDRRKETLEEKKNEANANK